MLLCLVCLTLLDSLFLPSHLSLKHVYIYTHILSLSPAQALIVVGLYISKHNLVSNVGNSLSERKIFELYKLIGLCTEPKDKAIGCQ